MQTVPPAPATLIPVQADMPSRVLASGSTPHLSPLGLVGNTPVLWIGEPLARTPTAHGYWAKLEGFNPGGIKDRTALYMVSRARERGELEPGRMIIESTSGTLGLGLALAGISYGHPVTLVSDPGMEPIMHRLLSAHGARVETVESPHPLGGWQEARRQRVRELMDANPGSYCPDQYHNPDNTAGYASLAYELLAQVGRIDVLVCSVGTGGHSAGVSAVLRAHCPDLHVVGVDAVGSTIFGQPARPRLMRGLGSSIYPSNVDYATFDEVHWVAPSEAVWTARQLAAARYASGGWSVGAVALVAGWLARTMPLHTRIVAIFPDGPQRYYSTIYDDAFCEANGLLSSPPPAEPDVVTFQGEREVTTWTRCTNPVNPTRSDGGQVR